MNKRIYLLLLPVFVLISMINYKGGVVTPFKSTTAGYSFSANENNSLPYSVTLNKKQSQKIKNTIRIKAWDGQAAIVFSEQWQATTAVWYNILPVFFDHNRHVLSGRLSFHQLRGPPALV